MKSNLSRRTLSEMKQANRDPHIDTVLEAIFEHDDPTVQFAIEKFANWVLDKEGPSISGAEFADEIRELICHRSECALVDAEESTRAERSGAV